MTEGGGGVGEELAWESDKQELVLATFIQSQPFNFHFIVAKTLQTSAHHWPPLPFLSPTCQDTS